MSQDISSRLGILAAEIKAEFSMGAFAWYSLEEPCQIPSLYYVKNIIKVTHNKLNSEKSIVN